jgi:hypothetical protein
MGYMFCTGSCVVCHRLFTFNPELVPSVVVDGTREPICRPCVERANPLRKAKGLPEIPVMRGAYDCAEVV